MFTSLLAKPTGKRSHIFDAEALVSSIDFLTSADTQKREAAADTVASFIIQSILDGDFQSQEATLRKLHEFNSLVDAALRLHKESGKRDHLYGACALQITRSYFLLGSQLQEGDKRALVHMRRIQNFALTFPNAKN